MKINSQLLKKITLSLLISSATSAYAGNVTPCINIINHFNKPALAALFSNKQNIQVNLTSSSPMGAVGCYVQTNIS